MKKIALVGLISIATSVSQPVCAEQTQGNQLTLSLDAEYGTIDNFFYSDTDEVSEQYWQISPLLNVKLQSERQQFNLETKIDHTQYADFDVDDHSDVLIKPTYIYKFSQNSSVYFDGRWQQVYEDRGTGLSIGEGQSLTQGDEKTLSNLIVGYTLGSNVSTAKFDISLGYHQQEYDTRRAETYILDQAKTFATLSFDYRLPSGTFIATDLNYQTITFDNNPKVDKDKWSLLVGAKWQKSAISQFSALVGYQKVSFNESDFEDDSAFKWRVTWNWKPVETLDFSFISERDFDEANRLTDSYRLVDKYGVTAASNLSDFFVLSANFGFSKQQIIYIDSTDNEDFVNAGLTLEYLANQRLSLFARYEFQDLDASGLTLPYQRNSFSIGINVSI